MNAFRDTRNPVSKVIEGRLLYPRSSPNPSFTAEASCCSVPRYRSVVWTEAWPSSSWICSRSPPARRHNFAQVRRRSWGASSQLGLPGIANHQTPDDLFVQDPASLHLASFRHRPEDPAFGDSGHRGPPINAGLDPGRDGDGADPISLADQIRQHPAGLALLQVLEFTTQKLCTAEAAADKQGQDGSVALTGQGLSLSRSLACSLVNQFPSRVPWRATPVTRPIAAATDGSSRPLSAISRARRRTGARRRLTVVADSPCSSRCVRYFPTSAFEKVGPTSEVRIQLKNRTSPVR